MKLEDDISRLLTLLPRKEESKPCCSSRGGSRVLAVPGTFELYGNEPRPLTI